MVEAFFFLLFITTDEAINDCFRGDVVEIDTWVAASGKNGMRRDWMIRDCSTGKIITRATRWMNLSLRQELLLPQFFFSWYTCSNWVMMNRETRKLSKLPEQVREEVKPFYLERRVFFDGSCDNEKIEKLTEDTAENIKSGLAVSVNFVVRC